jgi:menaquinol-cytochrome c reductase cytochrome b subunit
MAARMIGWLDERMGLLGIWKAVFDRKVPKVNWWYTLGSASLFLALMQAVTGITFHLQNPPTTASSTS